MVALELEKVPIMVQNMTGDMMSFELDNDAQVYAVKDRIAREWLMPAKMQRIIHSSSVLEDSVRLAALSSELGGKPVLLTMVASFETIEEGLQSTKSSRRVEALVDLAALGLRAGSGGMDLAALQLDDEHVHVRYNAVRAIAKVARRGNQLAMALVSARLDDEDDSVRWAAMSALGELAHRGDATAIRLAGECLDDESPDIRQAAVRALASLAPRDDLKVTEWLRERLRDRHRSVRKVADEALMRISRAE